MIRRSWLAQINFHSQSPRIRMSWLTQRKFQRQSPRTRMLWLAQQRNFRWQRDNSQSPRTIRIPHLAPQNFQPKDTIPNSAKIWIESFVVGRISWWGAGDEGRRDRVLMIRGCRRRREFFTTLDSFSLLPSDVTYIHTYMAVQPELEWRISTKSTHTHIFPENERLSLISRLGGQE